VLQANNRWRKRRRRHGNPLQPIKFTKRPSQPQVLKFDSDSDSDSDEESFSSDEEAPKRKPLGIKTIKRELQRLQKKKAAEERNAANVTEAKRPVYGNRRFKRANHNRPAGRYERREPPRRRLRRRRQRPINPRDRARALQQSIRPEPQGMAVEAFTQSIHESVRLLPRPDVTATFAIRQDQGTFIKGITRGLNEHLLRLLSRGVSSRTNLESLTTLQGLCRNTLRHSMVDFLAIEKADSGLAHRIFIDGRDNNLQLIISVNTVPDDLATELNIQAGKVKAQGTFGTVRGEVVFNLFNYDISFEKVKKLDKARIPENGKLLADEINFTNTAARENPYVLKVLGQYEATGKTRQRTIDEKIYLRTEYGGANELGAYIDFISQKAELDNMDLRIINKMFVQFVRGFYLTHQNGITHRDIKPENILIGNNDGRVKIIDFGMSEEKTTGNSRSINGTPIYYPPEVLKYSKQIIRNYRIDTIDEYSLARALFPMFIKIIENFVSPNQFVSDIVAEVKIPHQDLSSLYSSQERMLDLYYSGIASIQDIVANSSTTILASLLEKVKLLFQLFDPDPNQRISFANIMASNPEFNEDVVFTQEELDRIHADLEGN